MHDYNNLAKSGERDWNKFESPLNRRADTITIDHPKSGDRAKYCSAFNSGSRKGRKG
jgi:hypothetical protein